MAGRAGTMATGVQFMNKASTYGTLLDMQCGEKFLHHSAHLLVH